MTCAEASRAEAARAVNKLNAMKVVSSSSSGCQDAGRKKLTIICLGRRDDEDRRDTAGRIHAS